MTTLLELINQAKLDDKAKEKLILEFGSIDEINLQDDISLDVLNGYLRIAVFSGFCSSISFLLMQGTNIELKDLIGSTLLHDTVKYDLPDSFKLLINNGANIEAIDEYGNTPLHFAADDNRDKMLQLLLEKGANIEARTIHKKTPLHGACDHAWDNIVRLLLDHGANIEAIDDGGRSPLHRAIQATTMWSSLPKKTQTIRYLLYYGSKPANLHTLNNEGYTPLDLVKYDQDCPEAIKESLFFYSSLIKSIHFIPTPSYRDIHDSNMPPTFYKLPKDVILKILVKQLQNRDKIDDIEAERLILEMASKQNKGILKALMQNMAEQIFDATNGTKINGVNKEVEAIYQKLSPYSNGFYFFSSKQRSIFVKEISGKSLSVENIGDAIDAADCYSNEHLNIYLASFMNG